MEITTTCREDTAMRDGPAADAKSVLGDNTISGPIYDARIALQYGRYGLEIQINFFSEEGSKSWVVIRRAYTDTLRKCRQDAMSPCTQKPSPCRTQVLALSERWRKRRLQPDLPVLHGPREKSTTASFHTLI